MSKLRTILIPILLFTGAFISLHAKNVMIENLRTEYTEAPLGIDVETPRFSWQMKTMEQKRGVYQTAYRIIVTDESGKQVWDSGKIQSDISLNIEYAGTPLIPCTKYIWHVTVWDNRKKAYTANSCFETGLMSDKNKTAWGNAKWIGGSDEDMVLYTHYLPVFKVSFTVRLDEQTQTTRAGFIYGANDERLLNRHRNEYNLQSKKDESYLKVVLDISPLDAGEEALLHLYRTGYHPNDKKENPLNTFRIPISFIHKENRYENHTFIITSNFGYSHIYLQEEKRENLLGEINLNPLGRGGDFLAFPVVGDIGFRVPENQSATFSNIEIRNYRSPGNRLFSMYEKEAHTIRGGTSGSFEIIHPEGNSSPMLRTVFTSAGNDITKARLYVTARGIYEIYLNGKRMGDDYFNPGLTQYNKTHLYQTYDVTDHIQSGENALGAILAEGWWSGGATYSGHNWNFFGDRQSLLAKLVITYKDGKEKVIVTDPVTWQYYNKGPVMYGSFFQGEVYDATREQSINGWSTASYNNTDWKTAHEIPLQGTISEYSDPGVPLVNDYSGYTLTGQFGPTVKAIKELTAISVEEIRPGVFIYDMGQNMAGVPKIELSGMKSGQKVCLRFAEVKYPDLPEYQERVGMMMMENIRAALAQDTYITRGGDEAIQPRFTFHGYRYVEISGIEKPLPLADVKGVVLSSVHNLASHYETSNPKVNKLWENITWSTYGNFISIPTDCPQRNERLGWSGDISVFSRTATYLADMPQFLKRHIQALRDTQREDGRFADIAPLGGGFGEILWGSAGIVVPWESYLQYEDKTMLAGHYESMHKYIDYLLLQIDPETNVLGEKFRHNWGSLGDWLSPEYDQTEKTLLWEAYFIYNLEIMSKIATILQKEEDAEKFIRLHAERKAFFNQTYFNESGKTVFRDKVIDTQASYVLPLVFGITNDKNKEAVCKHLHQTLTHENNRGNGVVYPPYSLMTGFIGTAWISKALSDAGYTEAAYRLLQQTSYPSWLYPVEQGATTIWERLNSYTHTDGFGGNNRMNSFNHYSFGAVGAWMYNHSLGIERDPESPGFKHFFLHPETDPTGEMTFAEGYYDSLYGRIESSWKKIVNGYSYSFTIPANTTATIQLQISPDEIIKENGKQLKAVHGITSINYGKEAIVINLRSGNYNFTVEKK